MSVNCQQATEQVGNGVAAALRGVDCIAGEASAAAFGRLFAPGGSLGTVLTLVLTLFIALFAFALLTGRTNIGVRSLVPRMMTLGLVLTFATSWIAYQSVVWNLAVATPDYLAGVLTGTQGSATDVFAQKIDVVFLAIQEASAGAQDISTFSPEGMMWFGAMLFMLGTVGLLVTTKIALGGLVAAAVVLTQDKGEQQKVIVEKIIEREKVVTDPATAKKLPEAEAAREAAEAKLAEKGAAAQTDGGKPTKDGSSKGSNKPSSNGGSASANDAAPEATAPAKKEKDGIDGILGALDEPEKKDGTSAASNSKLPKQLSKPQVQSTIKKYNSRIKACGSSSNSGKLSGTVWVAINIAPSGKVSSANITSSSSSFKGTDLGNCVLGIVRAIKFPEAQEGLDISKYPFIIN